MSIAQARVLAAAAASATTTPWLPAAQGNYSVWKSWVSRRSSQEEQAPRNAHQMGLPVLLRASRMVLYSAKAVVWSLDAEQESDL